MTYSDAQIIIKEFYQKSNPTREDQFEFIEALEYLIDTTKDPKYMMKLGGYYYGEKRFQLALKYYEMADELNHDYATVCLGYIWYYGRTGTRDYEKAYHYYKKAADRGDITCKYKLADMYKNGYYVEKDYDKYKEIIEELYPQIKNAKYLEEPLPEIFTRLARIRLEEDRKAEAARLLVKAKYFLAQRNAHNPFFGNLSIMHGLINDLYRATEFNEDIMDIYDLYYVLREPCTVTFEYYDDVCRVQSVLEDGAIVINFEGKWFRTIDDFFAKATIDDYKLTEIWEDLDWFEIIQES